MYDAPNAVEELKQPRKHPTEEKVESIKETLVFWGIVSINNSFRLLISIFEQIVKKEL